MGGLTKNDTISGKTLNSAFSKIQKSDEEEYGNDIYSGGWNNAYDIREVDSKEFEKFQNGNIEKSLVVAKVLRKPIKNTNKIKTSVLNFPVKGSRQWVTRYEARAGEWNSVIASEFKQADAIKKVREYVEKHPERSVSLHITKQLVGGDTKVAEISYKKSTTEKDGQWEIYGVMSY